ncbi:MAG TPA: phosphoribosylglycinamide formyltransferase [Candidatus Limnocylindrales bacterium]|nr:phosphoribosylglycinamide formyltransferase [Candidatus Limnocylindrales bacterium]
MELLSIGILASGSGTNFDSIAAAVASGEIPARIAVLVCNRPAAPVIAKAKARGIPVRVVEHRAYATRELFDTDVASTLETAGVGLVVMAGFDRLITGALLGRFPQRIVNIHPALLPAFRGSNAQAQAAEHGVTIAGATVHFVDEDVDHGPIILQGAVPVVPGEDAETIRQRILALEHRIYPEALRLIAEGRVTIDGRFVRVRGRAAVGTECFVSPPIGAQRSSG